MPCPGAAASAPCLTLATGCPRTLPWPRGHAYIGRVSSPSAFLPPPAPQPAFPGTSEHSWGGAPFLGTGLGRAEPGAQGSPLLNFWRRRDPRRTGPATPGSTRISGSLADSPRDLQPDKQTPLEPELKLKEPGGQCPSRKMGEDSALAEEAQQAPEAVRCGGKWGQQGGAGRRRERERGRVCVCVCV